MTENIQEDYARRLEIADEAKRLLASPLFNGVLNSLTKDYLDQLMGNAPGSEKGTLAHSSLNAMSDIKSRLRSLENDGVMLRDQIKKAASRE